MKKEIADKWVEALRSGKYSRGRGKLRTPTDEFCCLGVLCDISEVGKWEEKDSLNLGGIAYMCQSQPLESRTGYPPISVRLWAGLKSQEGIYDSDGHNLVEENDNGKSFEQIADIIEQNWEKL